MTYKTYSEEDLLQLSALQHILFCERQCALIHNEQQWSENRWTAEGNILHDRVDSEHRESRGVVRIEYAVPIRSLRLGLIGKADVVEFHQIDDKWRPFPVEYKRGKAKSGNFDKVQLCAQGLCLEEMLHAEVPRGSLFYGKTRRRLDVEFDMSLRKDTEETAKRLHELIKSGLTPKPVYTKKCDQCSLYQLCMPKALSSAKSANKYLLKAVEI